MSKIVAADSVDIDGSDVRQVIDTVPDTDLPALQEMLNNGEMELAPGLVGWGRYNFTMTHRETGTTYHVLIK